MNVDLFVRIVCFMVVLWIVIYLLQQFKKKSCSSVSLAPIRGISSSEDKYKYKLRDYHIKSSYNSCARGDFKNDWVNLCALENVIKQGCRCLDFEIYQVDGRTVVATSDSNKVTEKGTYNSLPIDSVIKTIAEKAVSNSMTSDDCPNPYDPLLLHFRIKSNHIEVYDDIADALVKYLDSKLLPNENSYENNGENLGALPLNTLLGKVIIMVDKIESNHIRATKMDELTNIMGNSAFLHSLRYDDIIYTPDMDEMIDYNKKNMTIAYPNLTYQATNYDSSKVMFYGVQMPAMCFQINDPKLEAYNKMFELNNTAFILKPEDLRYIPVEVKEATPIDPKLSYGYNSYKSDQYNFNL